MKDRMWGRLSIVRLFLLGLLVGLATVLRAMPVHAQSYGADLGFLSLPVETVTVTISNPRAD